MNSKHTNTDMSLNISSQNIDNAGCPVSRKDVVVIGYHKRIAYV